jgi:hypothetical protein
MQVIPCAGVILAAVLTYGDIPCRGWLLHSPRWLRTEFFPRLNCLNDACHEHGVKCLFHSDGYAATAIAPSVGIPGRAASTSRLRRQCCQQS